MTDKVDPKLIAAMIAAGKSKEELVAILFDLQTDWIDRLQKQVIDLQKRIEKLETESLK